MDTWPSVDWFEVLSENYLAPGGRPLSVLDQICERYPVALHGVSLSLGSTSPLNRPYLKALQGLIRRTRPAWVSDHLCWTGVDRKNGHDLFPLPYTEEALRHVVQRVRRVQEILERPILIENVSSYMGYRASTMPEWEFLSRIAEEADAYILLDVNNIYVSAVNHRFNPMAYLEAVPPARVIQFHLAGHRNKGTHLLDTHDQPIIPEVWELFRKAVARFPQASSLIEWDDHIPPLDKLLEVAQEAKRIAEEVSRAHAA